MPKTEKSDEIVSSAKKVGKAVKKKVKELVEEIKEIGNEITEEVKETAEDLTEEKSKKLAKTEKDEKLAKLKEKAENLAKKIKTDDLDLKKEIKSESEKPEKETLVPIEDYLKSSMHLGTRAITPDMKKYVYKRRADSLAVFNTSLLDEKMREAADYLAQFAPDEIVLVCKREAGEKAAELFSQVTGVRAFIKKYPGGILTNPNLENFMETELLFICDPWMDKSALEDAKRIKIPVMAICDTNNYTMHVDKVIPGNNKSAKSLGFIFYLLAKLYAEKRKLGVKVPPISEWVENWDNLIPPK